MENLTLQLQIDTHILLYYTLTIKLIRFKLYSYNNIDQALCTYLQSILPSLNYLRDELHHLCYRPLHTRNNSYE